ncbi:MAG: hypothetical protein ACO1NZ_11335 [Adhaeribacter sp.]
MKNLVAIGIFLLMYLPLFAQNSSDSIVVKKAMGVVFLQNGKTLKPRQLLDITQSNPEAFQEMKKAKSNFDVGYVFSLAGGTLVGWTLGTALGGGEPNWAVAGVGAGLIGVSIPFSAAYSKHAKNAVRTYNGALHHTGMNKVDLRFGLAGSGPGLRLVF